MQAVNLLPEYAQPGHRWASAGSELSARRIVALGGGAATVAALLLAGLFLHERSTVNTKKNQLATAQAHLVAQEARAAPIKDAQAQSAARLAMLRSVTATRVHWDSVLSDLGRVLPSGVHLNNMSVSSPAAAVVGTVPTSSFTVGGTTGSHDRVALVLDRLTLLPWLSGVALQSSSGTPGSITFTISAGYVGSAGS
jgi:Tfp pilus assembly protein PilN